MFTVNTTSFQNLTMLGVNTSADSTNKFAVASAAILFNHIGTDMQVKINKNAIGNKASFLFQTGFSGRAEFGLLGDDNFTLKVSADGSTFFDALKMLAANGRVALKSNAAGLSGAGTTQGTSDGDHQANERVHHRCRKQRCNPAITRARRVHLYSERWSERPSGVPRKWP